MARRNQVIAVVIRQYGTGLYRTCISLGKDDVTFLTTHKDEGSANETIGLFWQAYAEGQLKTPEDVAAFGKTISISVEPGRAIQTDHVQSPVFLPLAA
jgi:hypothetical protein